MIESKDLASLASKFPHFISLYIRRTQSISHDRNGVGNLFTLFEVSLRYVTIIITCQYLIYDRHRISDPYLNKLFPRHLPIGDLQSWYNLLTSTLKAYEGLQDELFIPAMYRFYWMTSGIDQHQPNTRQIELTQKLIACWNDWTDQKNIPDTDAGFQSYYKEIFALVLEWVDSIRFLCDYQLIRITHKQASIYIAEDHTGEMIQSTQFNTDYNLRVGNFYLTDHGSDYLLMDPLVIAWPDLNEEMGIFTRLTKHTHPLYWLALTGEFFRDTTRIDDFFTLLNTVHEVKEVIRDKFALTWIQVALTAADIRESRMAGVASRYDSHLYLQRSDLIEHFREFLNSDRRCFVLTGKSGAGKSNFVLSLVQEFQADPDICFLMLDGAQLDPEVPIEQFLNQEFGLRWGMKLDQRNLWSLIDQVQMMVKRKFCLVIDGLNENPRADALLTYINEILMQPWPWLKILITSRPEAWSQIIHGRRLAEGLFFAPKHSASVIDLPYLSAFSLHPFSMEELEIVYQRYQSRYSINSSFKKLSYELTQFIREPLQLWIIANTYQEQEIPDLIPPGKLVDNYIAELIRSGRILLDDILFLQNDLVPLLEIEDGHFFNSISVSRLGEMDSRLIDRIFSNSKYSTGEYVNAAFRRLADAQIVAAEVMGVDSKVNFRYDRFFDYFLGNYIFAKIQKSADHEAKFNQFLEKIDQQPIIWGAVQRALYLTLVAGKIDQIENIARRKFDHLVQLLVSVFTHVSFESPVVIRDLIFDFLDKPRYQFWAKEAGLRTGLNISDESIIIKGILSPDPKVRSLALQYTYYLNRLHPDKGLQVLSALSTKVRKMGLPNLSVVQTIILLGSIFLVDNKDDELYRSKFFSIVRATIRQIMYAEKNTLTRKSIRTWLLRFIVQDLLRVFQLASTSQLSVSNFQEWERVFTFDMKKREPVFKVLPYIDPQYGTDDELMTLLPQIRGLNAHLPMVILNCILQFRGTYDPEWVLTFVRQLFALDDGRNLERIDAIYIWFVSLDYQESLRASWLDEQKNMVRRFLLEGQYGYGKIKTDMGIYEYYPLMFYASLVNRLDQSCSVDLIDEFLDKASQSDDLGLLIHIIDGFSDNRFRLKDYRGPLRCLIPYVHSKNSDIQSHMIQTLSRLFGSYPEQISHFLIEAESNPEYREIIKRESLKESKSSMYARGNFFITDALKGLSQEGLENVVQIFDVALRQKTFNNAAELIIKRLFNALGGADLFTE